MKGLIFWYLKIFTMMGLSSIYFQIVNILIDDLHVLETLTLMFVIMIYIVLFLPLLLWIVKSSLVPKT